VIELITMIEETTKEIIEDKIMITEIKEEIDKIMIIIFKKKNINNI